MEKLLSNPENTYMAVSLSGNTDKEVLEQMASALQEEGYVKETFSDAIIQREISFPTGLPMGGINVAIPHTDPEHVNKAGFCLGILDKPVTFNVMATEGEKVDVSVVFMLAIKRKEDQLENLQKLIAICQDQEMLKALLSKNIDTINEVMTAWTSN